MKKYIEKLFMTGREVLKFFLIPLAITWLLVYAFDIHMMGFSIGWTGFFFSFVTISRGIYKYDILIETERLAAEAEYKAWLKAEQEKLMREGQAVIEHELISRWWDDNFQTVCSWRDEITGKGAQNV